MAAKKIEITYTPEELAEIDRIIRVITEEPPPFEQVVQPEAQRKPVVEQQVEEDRFDIEHYDTDIPSDLSLEDEIIEPEIKGEVEEEIGKFDEPEFRDEAGELDELSNIDEEEIEDITDIITGPEEPAAAGEEILELGDSDIAFLDEAVDEKRPEPEIGEGGFDEFEDITDAGEFAEETPGKTKSESIALESVEDIDIPDLDEISLEDSGEIPEAEEKEIPDIDFGDLDRGAKPSDDFSEIETPGEFEEMDLGIEEEAAPAGKEEISTLDEIESFDEGGFEDIEEISDISIKTSEPAKPGKPEIEEIEEIDTEISDFSEDLRPEGEPLTIEPLDDDGFDHLITEEAPAKTRNGRMSSESETSEIELSEKDLARLKKAIVLFNPAIRQAIRDTIINDRLSNEDTRKLVDMIITGKPEDNIQKFLEKRLKIKIELADETVSGRRVIASRPEYTLEGRERQKRLLKATKIFGISTILAFTLTILSYQFIYKPVMAKKLIHKGVELIVQSGVKGSRFERKSRYDEAERLFREVDEEYAKDYLYGYNEYARAYLQNRDYKESLEKLNRAYEIDRTHIDTLNNLGYFYAKIDDKYFSLLAKDVRQWYFSERKEIEGIKTPLDLSINFYRRVLLLDNENVTALLGIGNAYFFQGQYLKARKYYEDILRVDSDSVIGYSGLLNLYIERNSFPQVAQIHAELRDKKMLKELPSPLLSKLAGYYLDKRKKEDSSVRIDYGVRTSKLIDKDDNTYPAVIEVLKALNDRDESYPQLHIQFARLNLAQDNLIAAKRYLDRALDLSPNYYSALHLLGEYYYSTKEPVKAYKSFKGALDNYGNQPWFTKDDFYKETEQIGKTNAYLGNIFYYFFDKVKSREGALDEEMIDNEIEKMSNYTLAQQHYIDAVNQGYSSPELHYNLGRIYYMKRSYSAALSSWLHLYDDFVKSPELMLSLGNAFYYNNNLNAAKGEYLKLISVMEYEADKLTVVDPDRVNHVKIFQSLSSAYNNLGVVYNDMNDYAKRDLALWKSVENGSKLDRQNEYARVNMARGYRKDGTERYVLDESVPYSIDIYQENMRD
ncbi:MAG TPA: tetratricopeptide repeat protein [Spirochaetota bacterium]|nr:tetratricopeptide repeat protein [Spirochaetota bacterium]